ncbi:hypothetical protein GN157_05665 [Flavobacterium rakeshii]|uniref:Uncharacterized protein n=2 Tax=Flavobacterium TaxID=237 RepID=A0A0A2LYL7_9FLAO|nr:MULTISPECIES: hypothetical protein [Flavobacterium]KGO84451.1 hypothetical protein Q763_01535 [Flavobacterium beibuense F44-8]MUV03192.1 hypothetical protein [Flavobacterium rakeshii]
MKAETAYNVIQALPEEEKNRLFLMLGMTKKEKTKKVNENMDNLIQEYKEMALKILTDRKAKKFANSLTPV